MEKTSPASREEIEKILSIEGISKAFDGLTVIDNMSLALEKNSFVSLVGPSGCGKSTFFDMLTGSINPDRGYIIWKGKKQKDLSHLAAPMGQRDLLLPWLTLIENVLLPKQTSGKESQEDREKAQYLLTKLGLKGFEQYLPHQISGGMRQRCALARTLLFERELLLLDEPLSALDAITRSELQTLLVSLQKDFDRTIVMITHDVEEALITSDVVLVLSPAPMKIIESYDLRKKEKPRKREDIELINLRGHILRELQRGTAR